MFETIKSADHFEVPQNNSLLNNSSSRNLLLLSTMKKVAALNNTISSVKNPKGKDDDTYKLVDLLDPDKYIYKEDEMIKNIRLTKEEERRKRDLENAMKLKNDKVLPQFNQGHSRKAR